MLDLTQRLFGPVHVINDIIVYRIVVTTLLNQTNTN